MSIFVLTATSKGDWISPPSTTVVAASPDREAMEALRMKRAQERAEYLAKYPLPQWAEYAVIGTEEIVECQP